MDRLSYLDWNATAPVRPEVALRMAETLAQCGNPSSIHRYGRAARRALEAARLQVAALVGADPAEIIFTSGGTEANQLALKGIAGRRLIVSAIEHDSVLRAMPDAALLPVTAAGIVDLTALDRLLGQGSPALVSVMLANNETGAIQPVEAVAALARRHGALLHCDGVQAAGKIALDRGRLGVDLLSLSAHKLGGPAGVGALVAASDLPLAALQRGGGQERGRRAGTENLPGIIGFGLACSLAGAELARAAGLAALRDLAEARLRAEAPDAVVFAADAARLPNTSCIAMPGVAAATQVMALDLAGVMVSAGSACSSGKVRRSHVLTAMAVPADLAASAIRVSIGRDTTAAEIDHLVEAWGALYRRSRARAA